MTLLDIEVKKLAHTIGVLVFSLTIFRLNHFYFSIAKRKQIKRGMIAQMARSSVQTQAEAKKVKNIYSCFWLIALEPMISTPKYLTCCREFTWQ